MLATGDVLVSENAYAAGSTLPPHHHRHAFLSVTLSGGYDERHGPRTVAYAPRSIAYHPAGEEHAVAIGTSDVRCLNVELSPRWTSAARRSFVRAVGGPLAWLAHDLLQEARGAAAALAVEATVLEMLGILGASPSPASDTLPPRWLDHAEEILRVSEYTPSTCRGRGGASAGARSETRCAACGSTRRGGASRPAARLWSTSRSTWASPTRLTSPGCSGASRVRRRAPTPAARAASRRLPPASGSARASPAARCGCPRSRAGRGARARARPRATS
jgi:hypothetical protein